MSCASLSPPSSLPGHIRISSGHLRSLPLGALLLREGPGREKIFTRRTPRGRKFAGPRRPRLFFSFGHARRPTFHEERSAAPRHYVFSQVPGAHQQPHKTVVPNSIRRLVGSESFGPCALLCSALTHLRALIIGPRVGCTRWFCSSPFLGPRLFHPLTRLIESEN